MKISEFQGEHRFLSNFWSVSVRYEGLTYPTVEHAYQAAKTFDKKTRIQVRNCSTPGNAKRAGKLAILRSDWEDIKVEIMLELLRIKFSDVMLKQKLLDTGIVDLEEGNRWGDTFWGICPPNSNNGQNNLGKLLMQVRDEIMGVSASG